MAPGAPTQWLLGLLLWLSGSGATDQALDEAAAREYLAQLDHDVGIVINRAVNADWDYAANLTERNLKRKLKVSAESAAFQKAAWFRTIRYPWQDFTDSNLQRQFKKYSFLGDAALPPEKFEKLDKLISEMEAIYSTAKVCDYFNKTKCDLSLEPHLIERMAHSRDANELRHLWVEWRHASGEKCRGLFERYVALSNESSILNNYTDTSEVWLEPYEAKDFRDQVRELWEQLRPLYEQLHAYVRRKLREIYGEAEVSRDGPIPAHLVGNMWSQSWDALVNKTRPAPNTVVADVTPEMVKQGYTPLRIFKLAEKFFTSINMSVLPVLFWQRSVLEKPKDREITCHPTAWDFYDGQDFRIKQCTTITMAHMTTAHHEMGHVQYGMQYKHQPIIYRSGANPGFHEAVGDVIALSVSTPKHLRKIGLLKDEQNDEDSTMNYLYLQALLKVAYLPFAYLMDLWRWDVFNGNITSHDYNCRWWELREKYQGIEPPVDRTEEDFDPGAKFHIVTNVPYIRYFVSHVIQFQIHRALCLEAGEYVQNDPSKPLYNCDIYESIPAGERLKAMLQLGSSVPWQDALEVGTGSRRMDASALLDYFKPLHEWLKAENARTGERVGWGPSRRKCVASREDLKPVAAAGLQQLSKDKENAETSR